MAMLIQQDIQSNQPNLSLEASPLWPTKFFLKAQDRLWKRIQYAVELAVSLSMYLLQ